jgi:lactate dehydrogenase-like 2-hydroxyacid dehydrogenase
MDCTSSILKKFLNKKFTYAQMKWKAIVVNVLSLYAKSQILEDLKNIKYCCLAIDASNHIDLKRYFIPDKGIAIEILEFSSLPGETSDLLVDHTLEAAQKHDTAD